MKCLKRQEGFLEALHHMHFYIHALFLQCSQPLFALLSEIFGEILKDMIFSYEFGLKSVYNNVSEQMNENVYNCGVEFACIAPIGTPV